MKSSPSAVNTTSVEDHPPPLSTLLATLQGDCASPMAFLKPACDAFRERLGARCVSLFVMNSSRPIASSGVGEFLSPTSTLGLIADLDDIGVHPLFSFKGQVGVLAIEALSIPLGSGELELCKVLVAGALALVKDSQTPSAETTGHPLITWLGDSLAEGVIVTDDEGRLRYVNKLAQQDLELDQTLIERLSLTGLFASHQQAQDVLTTIETQGEFAGLVQLRRRQGIMQADVSAVPLSSPDGESLGILWLLHDQTKEREAAREQRRVAQLSAVGHLAAGTAHELNNPLSGVLGFTQLLLEESLPEDALRYLQLILDQARRCQRVIRNLLLFGQVYPASKGETQVSDVIADALEQGGYTWRAGHVRFAVELAGELPSIHGDGELLQEALFNVLKNSVDAMSDGGTVRIVGQMLPAHESPLQTDTVQISVVDTGQGMSKRVLQRVFQPFFTTREVGQGAGLGLSIAYGIVAEHGGDIRVDTVVWHGTTVKLLLPVRPEAKRPPGVGAMEVLDEQ